MPILVELVIVVSLTSLLRKHILDSETVKELVRRNFERSGAKLKDAISIFENRLPGESRGA